MPVSAPQPLVADTEAIWEEFHDQLLGFIRRRVRTLEAAEDILQEVMLRIHRQADGVENTEAVGAWVYAIARNAITDHYRRASVRREVAVGGELDPEEVGEAQTASPDLRSELSACVRPLLKRLAPGEREALTMTEVDGLTQTEAAARLGISTSGMKSRVQRARGQLKRVLLDCCQVDLDRRRGVAAYRKRQGRCGCGPDSQ